MPSHVRSLGEQLTLPSRRRRPTSRRSFALGLWSRTYFSTRVRRTRSSHVFPSNTNTGWSRHFEYERWPSEIRHRLGAACFLTTERARVDGLATHHSEGNGAMIQTRGLLCVACISRLGGMREESNRRMKGTSEPRLRRARPRNSAAHSGMHGDGSYALTRGIPCGCRGRLRCLVFNRALSANERTPIESYLGRAYGCLTGDWFATSRRRAPSRQTQTLLSQVTRAKLHESCACCAKKPV